METLIELIKQTIAQPIAVEGKRNNYRTFTFVDGSTIEVTVNEFGYQLRMNGDFCVTIPIGYDSNKVVEFLRGNYIEELDSEDIILSMSMREIDGDSSNKHVNKLLHLLARAQELDIDIGYNDGTNASYGATNYPILEICPYTTLRRVISDLESIITRKEKFIEAQKKANSSLFMKLKNAHQLYIDSVQAHQRG